MKNKNNPQTYPWISSYDEGVADYIHQPAQPMYTILDETVKKYGDRRAFDFLGKTYTWAQIGALSDKFACGLQNMGVQKGHHIGLFLPNCPYYLIAYYGVLKTGATVVNLNPLYAEKELAHLIENSQTDIVVTVNLKLTLDKAQKMLRDTRLKNVILCDFAAALPFPKNILFPVFKRRDISGRITDKRVIAFADITRNAGNFTPVDIDPQNDIAVLQYTGGTTGVPKGAMLTHANIYFNTIQCVSWFQADDGQAKKMLGVLPFFHVFAMTAIMNFSVRCGLEIIATPRFDLDEALKIIHTKRPHFFPAVPAIYTAINNFPDLKKYDLSSLEFCISGGAPLPVDTKRNFESITGCTVVEGYGLSESSPVVCINPVRGENIAGSIGLPVPNTIVEILSPDTHEPMDTGQRGELCVTGPQVMKGYWDNPDATAKTIINGRLHTGDIAIMDKRGYVFIVDRLKDMIITNGYNVYPRNVEEALYQHPNIEECIVAGLPDAKRGEIVKAWIKLKDGRELNERDLRDFLKDKISKMEIPKQIEFRTAPLPKTMIGKLSRKDVLAQEQQKNDLKN